MDRRSIERGDDDDDDDDDEFNYDCTWVVLERRYSIFALSPLCFRFFSRFDLM